MAKCTPDTAAALHAVVADLRALGHELLISDLFRSYEMQKAAHLDFVEKRKKAFSPAPGGSMHEAGRAMDVDLASAGVPLARFWEIAKANGFVPIISTPDASQKECWHFDYRGSHGVVYDYAKSGRAGTGAPYSQMARSAIAAIGVQLDTVADQGIAYLQAGLIRLGADPGTIDGVMGDRTRAALADVGASEQDPAILSRLLQAKFPGEFAS